MTTTVTQRKKGLYDDRSLLNQQVSNSIPLHPVFLERYLILSYVTVISNKPEKGKTFMKCLQNLGSRVRPVQKDHRFHFWVIEWSH